jgi:hypothetical protein
LLIGLVGYWDWCVMPASAPGWLKAVVLSMAVSNGFMALFNLLPALPLDGGSVIEAVAWKRTGSRAFGKVAGGVCGLIVAAGLAAYAVMVSWRDRAWESGSWFLVMAALVGQGAWAALRRGLLDGRLERFAVADLAAPAVPVRAGTKLASVDDLWQRLGARVAVVVTDMEGNAVGWVDPDVAVQVPPEHRAAVGVEAVATALVQGVAAGIDEAGAAGAARVMPLAQHAHVVPVYTQGRITGLLDMKLVVRAVRGK